MPSIMRHFGIPCFAMLVLLLGGCFEAEYERRLKTANGYFSHQELLDARLANVWFGNGVTFRVPKAYQVIPPPELPAAEEGGEQSDAKPAVDPRQPDFLEMDLPGLTGAWKATVTSDNREATAYTYLLVNPTEITGKMLEDFFKEVKVTLEPEDWRNESFPLQSDFVVPVQYQSLDKESEREVAGIKMRYKIYRHQAGGSEALVMFVLPSRMTDTMLDDIPFSLETLRVEGGGSSSTTNITPGSGL